LSTLHQDGLGEIIGMYCLLYIRMGLVKSLVLRE